MEPANGSDIAGNGADGQVLVTAGESFRDDPADEPGGQCPDPEPPR